AALTVQPGPLAATVVSPAQTTVTAGSTQAYRAEGFDVYGNDLGDLTPTTTFAIDGTGTCLANLCGSTRAGSHAVRGARSGVASTAALAVGPGPLASLALAPAQATIPAGATQAYSAWGSDAFGNDLGDLTSQATFLISGTGTCQRN